MHSRIFQIASDPIEEDEYINEEYIDESAYGYYGIDYACESESTREDDMEWLKMCLPENMFSVDADGVTILNDGSEYLTGILADAKALMDKMKEPKDLLGLDNYRLRKLLLTLGHSDVLFYFDEWRGMCYLEDVIQYARTHVGEKLYVGAILDYHY